ncbi:MAG: PadR family transcriptional regulator [Chloroflexota bacterium]
MATNTELTKYLPLSEASLYILLSLTEPRHGYAIMQHVEKISQGQVTIGPGTLYGAFSTFEGEKLIEMVSEENRRKSYILTEKGRQVLALQARRLTILHQNLQAVLNQG